MSDPEINDLRSTFPSYMAEGERFYLRGEYSKAAQSFSNALHLQNGDKNCLVARSKCFLKLGELEKSLKDAEASLQGDPTFCKGILQKAETLYTMGDFEFALVFYHRGYKLRPDREFRVGIQKAQEAINNSVGSPSSIKLENKGDLSFLSKQAESMKTQQKPHLVRNFLHHPKRESKQRYSFKSEKTLRQLLGELYVDKEYLEKLLLDKDLIKGTIKRGLTVEDLIMTGIHYLDTRSDFWRQQKPIYARERDRKLMRDKCLRDRKRHPSQTARYILKSLEDIDILLTSGSAEGSLQKAEKVLKKVLEWNKEEVPNKDELVGNLYSCIGNAQMELGQTVAALQSHRKDLEMAKEHDLPDAKSRALDNIGRVFARVGKFQQAIDTWEEKIPLAKTTLEKTWLFHEIGRCYLELDQAWQAQNYGEKSQQCAKDEGDIEWQLNASVLVAQAQVKLRDFQSAVNNFEKALEKAKLLHNNQAQQAIISALDDANRSIIEELRKTNYREMLREKKEREEAAELNTTTVMAKEKETRRVRDKPEKVVKQWEREQNESEKETEDELSKESLGIRTSRQEKWQRGIENPSPLVRPQLGTEEVAKKLYGEVGMRSGEEGSRPSEVSRQESREIYRRASELNQKVSEEFSRKESEGLEKRLSETSRRELEELEKTEWGEVGETETTENAGTVEKNEKEDT
ncbi:outer dynein arm-docking complex subunit 4 isoform X1 [Manis pentadactyla]|uniref:outer dynein arm-docking complex subunit 4 isoform X1 n=1 Tax=Manis pentadactyla TaxID=143292 RepID=UPI00255C7D04|nr:outer dynein arm-docking complex subunit 4 isoform X1 [Manis pentadactyla]KAI5219275.1 Tetratricopeptide Repeat Protein 25 [Manis pentadactyla]